MATPHVTRKKILYAEAETTEGTYEGAPGTDDTATTLLELEFSSDIRKTDRKPLKAKLSTLESLIGMELGRITGAFELGGSGVGATTVPKWSKTLVGCGMQQETADQWDATLGGTGTFIAGEKATDGGAKSVIIVKELAAPDGVVFIVTAGAPAATDVFTGEVSGRTATLSGTATTYGVTHRPDTDVVSHSVARYAPYDASNSTVSQLKGARGTWSLDAELGAMPRINFDFFGVIQDASIDDTTPSPAYDDYKGLSFKNAAFTAWGEPATDLHFTRFTFDIAHTNVERGDANSTGGAISVKLTDRQPTGTVDPELTKVSEVDWWDFIDSETLGELKWSLNTGGSAGDIVEFFLGRAKMISLGDADRNGILALSVGFDVHRVGTQEDSEIIILTR